MHGGEHGEVDRSASVEVSARGRTRRGKGGGERRHGQAGGTDGMTVLKHKLICEEKRKKKEREK